MGSDVTMASRPDSRHVVLSGCSGGGKSTLLAELAKRGFATVPEPGRRIVEEELRVQGRALPWVDMAAFARRALALAAEDRDRMAGVQGWIFFDRSMIDAVAALQQVEGGALRDVRPRYHRRIFMVPPWPELYTVDNERRHGWAEAVAEYDRLLIAYKALGYVVILLPKLAVPRRIDFLLAHLA